MKALLLLAATLALTLGAPDFSAGGGHHGEHHGEHHEHHGEHHGEHHEHHEGHHGDHGEHHERVAEDVVSYAAPVEPVKTVSGVRVETCCQNQMMICQNMPEYPRICQNQMMISQVGGCTLERRTEPGNNCFFEPECKQTDCSQQVDIKSLVEDSPNLHQS